MPAELSMFAASIVAHTWFRRGRSAAERLTITMIARHALMPRLQAAAPPAKAAVAKVVAMALEDLAESVRSAHAPAAD